MPDRIAFSDIVQALLRGILRGENPIDGAPLERAVVLKWLCSLSRRNTFVGGKCALPSAILVILFNTGTVRDPLIRVANQAVSKYDDPCGRWMTGKYC